MIGAVCFAVDREGTGAADAFTAIGIKRDWLLAALDQALIDDVEHFQKGGIR